MISIASKHIGIKLLLLLMMCGGMCLGQTDSIKPFSLQFGAGLQYFNYHYWSPDSASYTRIQDRNENIKPEICFRVSLGFNNDFARTWSIKGGVDFSNLISKRGYWKNGEYLYTAPENEYHFVVRLGVGKSIYDNGKLMIALTSYGHYDRIEERSEKFGSTHTIEFSIYDEFNNIWFVFEPFYEQSFTSGESISNWINKDHFVYGLKINLRFAL